MILVMLIYSSIFDKVTSCRIGVIVLLLSLSNKRSFSTNAWRSSAAYSVGTTLFLKAEIFDKALMALVLAAIYLRSSRCKSAGLSSNVRPESVVSNYVGLDNV